MGWSRTQSNVTLSSAEAELYALIKMLGGFTGPEEYDERLGTGELRRSVRRLISSLGNRQEQGGG